MLDKETIGTTEARYRTLTVSLVKPVQKGAFLFLPQIYTDERG